MSKSTTKKKTALPAKGSTSPKAKKVISLAGNPEPPDLNHLFVNAVKQMYWAENHLVAVLPKVRDAAGLAGLKKGVASHLEVTKKQAVRLEKVFALLGEPAQAMKNDAMEGLAMEGEGVINTTVAGTPARDMGLIMACRKVEHYEMAAYEGLVTLAKKLKQTEIADLLAATLQEEADTDGSLAALAEKNF
jgi:ferritin-like metal-binding protein YciE